VECEIKKKKKMTTFFLGGWGDVEWVLDGDIRSLFEEGSAGKLSSVDKVTLFFLETNRFLFYNFRN